MLAHEYSWQDAICLAHSSEGCGAAATGGQKKVKLDLERDWAGYCSVLRAVQNPAQPSSSN